MYDILKVMLDPLIFVSFSVFGGLIFLLRKKDKMAKTLFIGAAAVLYLFSITPIANGLSYILEKDYFSSSFEVPDKLDVVVVLAGGCSDNVHIKEKRMLPQTASRLLYAMQMFYKTGADHIICSGAKGRFAEGKIMSVAAQMVGIGKDKIKVDTESNNTRQHARQLSKLYNNPNLRIGLVTSAYHMKRSQLEFKKYFSNVFPLPSEYLYVSHGWSVYTFLPRTTNLYKSFTAGREIVGVAWYELMGRVREQ